MHFPEILSSGGRPVQTLTDCLNRNGLIGYVTRVFPLGKLPIEERAEEPITAIDHAVKEASRANAFLADRRVPSLFVRPLRMR